MLLVSSPTPVSCLGSDTESVIAAMSGVWNRYCIRVLVRGSRVAGVGLLVRMRVADAGLLLRLNDSVKHYDYSFQPTDTTTSVRCDLQGTFGSGWVKWCPDESSVFWSLTEDGRVNIRDYEIMNSDLTSV
nr:hypothetical protein [Tanacetum cinerariifolium]